MTMTQIQRRLIRIMRDMDTLAQELCERGLDGDWQRMESARTTPGQVCAAFLDERMCHELLDSSDMKRA